MVLGTKKARVEDRLPSTQPMKTRRIGDDSRVTMRGLTRGTILVGQKKITRPCVVIGDCFPSWLLYGDGLDLSVELLLLRSGKYSDIINQIFGKPVHTWIGSEWGSCLGVCTPFTGRNAACLVDGRVTSEILQLSRALGITEVFSTRRARKLFPGWHTKSVVVAHTNVGGVTDKSVQMSVHSVQAVGLPRALAGACDRDASTVLSHSTFARKFRAKPSEVYLKEPRVVNLGSAAHPYYHGNGWLPGIINRKTEVLTPVLNPPKNGDWGLRYLTGGEILSCKDVPEILVKTLLSLHGDGVFLETLLPGKCLMAGYTALSNGGGPDDGENKASRLSPGQSSPFSKRDREGQAAEQDEAKLRKTVSFAETRSPKSEANAARLNPVLDILDKKNLGSFPSRKLDGKCPQGVDAGDDGTVGTLETMDSTVFTQEQDDLDGDDDHLNQVAREERNKKATKADDAEVPEYLWLEHLAADDPPPTWNAGAQARLIPRTWIFQKYMLSWWKRSLSRTFIKWLNQKHSRFRKINSSTPHAKGEVEWIPGIPMTDPAGSILKDEKGKTRWIVKGKYVWATPDAPPIAAYREWWAARVESCGKDWLPGVEAIERAARSSWWNWDDGSRPFHWRWPLEYQDRIRDGIPVFFLKPMENYLVPQKNEKDPTVKARMQEKLQTVRDRRYVGPGMVKSLTAFFAVPKGDLDIRMVYDGSVSGLNEAIWMPRFALPTLQTHLRAVEGGTYMCDVDVGEMFLNFILHETIRSLTGVDLTHYDLASDGGKVWEAWQRAAMGLTSSPYQACQGMGFAEELIRGDPDDPDNIFRWDTLRLNLPGSIDYDATLPWVSKVRSDDGQIAADFCTFVDDARPTGSSSKEAWLAARRIASTFSLLGLQDAPRKRRDCSQTPGAWTGAVLRTDDGDVRVLIPEEKWKKTKVLLDELAALMRDRRDALPRKRLEQIRGYLVHIAQTYPIFSSYLIGLHMTIDQWRPNRDADGWRFATAYVQRMKDEETWPDDYDHTDAPATVKAVSRLEHDVVALQALTAGPIPMTRRVRARMVGKVSYGFADASGASFGASMQFKREQELQEQRAREKCLAAEVKRKFPTPKIQLGFELDFEYGQWSEEEKESGSSNWKELKNLVDTLCHAIITRKLYGYEIFMFTDNSTAEAAYWKGTSKSKKLFELVLQLKKLALDYDIIMHVIHVSGRRMIAEGTDGLSRADHSQGVMRGKSMLDFTPLHLFPFERAPLLKGWVADVTRGLDPTYLEPREWYTTGHGHGTFVWTVPPAAGDVVVEQLGRARLKRPESMHIIIIPRLMTGLWQRLMTRGTEAYFRLDWDEVWPLTRHYEPLLFFVCLPYRSASPRLGDQTKLLEEFRGSLLRSDLQEAGWCGGCYQPLGVKPFPVRKQLDEEGEVLDFEVEDKRFMVGRDGDNLMTPFQCELCHFRNIYGRDPLGTEAEIEVLELFRRASLDAFGCRAASTVAGNLRQGLRGQRFADRMEVPSLVPPMGPYPLEDSTGMLAAAAILDRSLDPGVNEEFVQWDTFRGMRTFVTNATQAGVTGLSDSIGAYEMNKLWISKVPTHSFWFSRFMGGLHKRVGEHKKQDEIITIDVLKAIEKLLERQWRKAKTLTSKRRVAEMGTWFIAGFVAGLRGEEMILLEFAGTKDSLQYLMDRDCPHVILVVSGRTKGNQLSGAKFGVPLAATTRGTHLLPGKWVERLIKIMTEQGIRKGRLFQRALSPTKLFEFENDFFKVITEIQRTTTLINADMNIEEEYGILRSLRRGMTAHARNMDVSTEHLKAMNRWASEMNSKTGAPRLDMPDVYATLKAIKPVFLRITRSF